MLTAEISVILLTCKKVKSTISVLLYVADDFRLKLIEHPLGVITVLPFDKAVLFAVCEHDAAEVVRNHDLEVGLRFLVEVDGHETLELLVASLLFEVLLVLLHALDFLHQIEVAHLLNVFSFASYETLEHLTRSRFQLKVIYVLKLSLINRVNITFGGLQI